MQSYYKKLNGILYTRIYFKTHFSVDDFDNVRSLNIPSDIKDAAIRFMNYHNSLLLDSSNT